MYHQTVRWLTEIFGSSLTREEIGQEMINMYRSASPKDKIKFWLQMTSEEQQSLRNLYAIEGSEIVRP